MRTYLVVDDDAAVCRVLQRYLERNGGQVILASNGQQALELVKTHPVHLMILDAKMPVMDGLEVLRQLKAQQSAVPVIMITASDEFEIVKESLALGAKDFIKKPIDLDYLDNSPTWRAWLRD
jgi:DNA-binding response OmpR family regulator